MTVCVESRVGHRFIYGEEAELGETVRFYYDGGSEPGYRTVTVTKTDHNGLEGPTVERNGEYRRYDDGNINGDIVVIHDAPGSTLRVQFAEAAERLIASLTGEQLAELYSKYAAVEGDGATFDPQTGDVVVMLPAPKNKVALIEAGFSGSTHVQLINGKGRSLNLFFYHGTNKLGVLSVDDGTNDDDVSIETLRDKIVEFLG